MWNSFQFQSVSTQDFVHLFLIFLTYNKREIKRINTVDVRPTGFILHKFLQTNNWVYFAGDTKNKNCNCSEAFGI
jgi:hypothetical protein